METKKMLKMPKMPNKIICEKCNFSCNKKSNYNKHILTQKHQNYILGDKDNTYNANKCLNNYICNDCDKKYESRNGLWKHRKTCVRTNTNIADSINNESNEKINILNLTNMVLEVVKNNTELLKQNQELQKQMVEVCKNSNNNSTNVSNSHNNSHNKTFNLQVFLNEDCKDAMNLSEFVNSLQLQLSDLDNMGKLGYTEGISKIILTEMNDLEQTKRPVHCSDIKRETLYVKDEDKWEKEQPDHPKLNKAIRKIEQKNFGLMGEWQAEHPTYKESTSEENNEFLKLISQTVNGTPDNINKVIKKIAKEVVIDK